MSQRSSLNGDGQQDLETDFFALLNLSLHLVSLVKILRIQYEGLVMSFAILQKISSQQLVRCPATTKEVYNQLIRRSGL